jgi:hypothetical protein
MDLPHESSSVLDPATRRLILLLPAAFVAHDIGEIAGNDELNRALGDIAGRFPSLAQRLAPSFTTSRPQMAVAVGVLTAGLTALSVAAARGRPRSPALTLHAAATLVFGGHIVAHAAQAVVLRRWLPGLRGGLMVGLPYSAALLRRVRREELVDAAAVRRTAAVGACLVIPLVLGVRAIGRATVR